MEHFGCKKVAETFQGGLHKYVRPQTWTYMAKRGLLQQKNGVVASYTGTSLNR